MGRGSGSFCSFYAVLLISRTHNAPLVGRSPLCSNRPQTVTNTTTHPRGRESDQKLLHGGFFAKEGGGDILPGEVKHRLDPAVVVSLKVSDTTVTCMHPSHTPTPVFRWTKNLCEAVKDQFFTLSVAFKCMKVITSTLVITPCVPRYTRVRWPAFSRRQMKGWLPTPSSAAAFSRRLNL